MNKLIGFDLEIAEEIEDIENIQHDKLGITCLGLYGYRGYRVYHAKTRLKRNEAQQIVRDMQLLVSAGYTITSCNGVDFDFLTLAHESGMFKECAELALGHCDYLLLCVARHGWRVGLDTLARGAGVESKLKNVTLNDGTKLEDMSGEQAPKLWRDGEYSSVLQYLKQDAKSTYEIGVTALKNGRFSWQSKSGRDYRMLLRNGVLPSVNDLIDYNGKPFYPHPNVSWMDSPPSLLGTCKWAHDASQ